MTVGGFIGVLVIGLIVGLLARFITPGPNPRGIIVTIVIGIVGACIATDRRPGAGPLSAPASRQASSARWLAPSCCWCCCGCSAADSILLAAS